MNQLKESIKQDELRMRKRFQRFQAQDSVLIEGMQTHGEGFQELEE